MNSKSKTAEQLKFEQFYLDDEDPFVEECEGGFEESENPGCANSGSCVIHPDRMCNGWWRR